MKQERQCTYKRDIEAHSCNNCGSGKTTSIIYSKCVFVALIIHHAKRMRRIILSSVVSPALPYFSVLAHKGMISVGGGEDIEHKTCVLIFSTNIV